MTKKDAAPASIDLKPGLNVITGPSDTGKSFIAECINFVLGSSKELREISQGAGYSQAFLEIETFDGRIYTLERSKIGGDIKLYNVPQNDITAYIPSRILAEKHSPGNPNCLSVFLLTLCQLEGKRLLLNVRNETRETSFRDMVRLLLIEEDQIIKKESPIWSSGQRTERTMESSLFRTLITGVDFSGLIANKKPVVIKAEREGKLGLLSDMILKHETFLATNSIDSQSLEGQISHIDEEINQKTKLLSVSQSLLIEKEKERNQAWNEVRKLESRLIVVIGLLKRFDLLEKQYKSDMSRLEATIEASHLIINIPEQENCPLCGSSSRLDHEHMVLDNAEIAAITDASLVEKKKIERLLSELFQTVKELEIEKQQLDEAILSRRSIFKNVIDNIKDILEPNVTLEAGELNKLINQRTIWEKSKSLLEQLKELKEQKKYLESNVRQKKNTSVDVSKAVDIDEIKQFCLMYKEVLTDWNYPEISTVTFSEKLQDFVISGKNRGSQGKGYRAITHAAFTVALLKFCREKTLPYSGFIALDSPLVTYRKPDVPTGEAISEDMKVAFYNNLATIDSTMQVVVFENEEPPTGIIDNINYIHFTKSPDVGRYGFFPLS